MAAPFSKKNEPDDLRQRATETIWKYATAMLAISIVFVGAFRSVVIPLAVIVGAALATGLVWAFQPEDKEKSSGRLAELEERIREIDDRLANVETISNYDRILAEKTAASERESRKYAPDGQRHDAEE